MSDLKTRLLKNSTLDYVSQLDQSKIYDQKDMIKTSVPMINVALSADVDGGLTPGLTQITGPSKHFKSLFGLLLASEFLKKYPEGAVLFYDSEFGTPKAYFDTFDIPMDRVIHSPLTDLEAFKFDVTAQLKDLSRDDKVMILVDSIGNLASKKEVDDALAGNSVNDMTRAKQIKSIFRMITPHLTIKDVPMVVINHIYMTQEMYSKPVVSGGTGIYLSSDTIWIIGRQQDKDGTELLGYNFIINVEKSRYVEEKSKIPITVSFDGGINQWSGLFDVALECGFIAKTKVGWYALANPETGEVEEKNFRKGDVVDDGAFWRRLFSETGLKTAIRDKYAVAHGKMFQEASDDA